MEFSAPVTYTVAGWVKIVADDIEDAKRKVKEMNDWGIECEEVMDPEVLSTVMIEGLNPIEQ